MSDVLIVASNDQWWRSVVAVASPFPSLRTVAYSSCTSTDTDPEQLFVVSDSPATASTHAL